MPQSAALVTQLRAAGLPAVISGAGPTVLVLARGEVEAEQALARTPAGWLGRRLPVDAQGASEAEG
jgi:homoserine kinase